MRKLMISAVVTFQLFLAGAMADNSELYLGLDVFGSQNDFNAEVSGSESSSANKKIRSSGLKMKFGTLLIYGLRLQGYLQFEKFDETLFDADHDRLMEIGLDLIKTFAVTPEFLPFVQGGLGYGWMDLDKEYYDDGTMNEVSLKIGAGVIYRVVPSVELLAGLDFQARKWKDIEYSNPPYYFKQETDDSAPRYYIGANVLF